MFNLGDGLIKVYSLLFSLRSMIEIVHTYRFNKKTVFRHTAVLDT